MGDLTDALTAALVGAGEPQPSAEPDAGDVFGEPMSNQALARAMNDIAPGSKLPPKGSDDRKRYDADLRRVQRYRAGEGRQQRGRARPDQRFVKRVKRASSRQRRRAQRRGISMKWRARIRVSQLWRVHTMPAGGALSIDADELDDVLALWAAGEEVDDELAAAFFDAYQLPGTEWGEPEWVTIEVQ